VRNLKTQGRGQGLWEGSTSDETIEIAMHLLDIRKSHPCNCKVSSYYTVERNVVGAILMFYFVVMAATFKYLIIF
jgi:hypothetical protein